MQRLRQIHTMLAKGCRPDICRRFNDKAIIKIGGDRAPKPFPGADPLRWWVEVRKIYPDRGNEVLYSYLGKPNVGVALSVLHFMSTPMVDTSVKVEEFDKGGIVASGMSYSPCAWNQMTVVRNAALVMFYRPWTKMFPVGWVLDGNPLWIRRQRVLIGGKKRLVYSNAYRPREEWNEWQRNVYANPVLLK